MAEKTMVVSDLSGEPATVRLRWSFHGTDYLLDCTQDEYDQFRTTVEKYLDKSQKLARTRSTATAGSSKSTDTSKIRTWARANGYAVSDRGVVKAEIVEAYEAAQK